jgi:hypothetical protein
MHRPSSSPRWIAIVAALVIVFAVIGAAALGAGVFTGNASALGLVAAYENINDSNVPIAYSASTDPSAWTSLGSVPIGPTADVLVASVGLRDTLAGTPSAVECVLSAPNEPDDLGVASWQGTKGSNQGQLSFEGVTTLPYPPGSAASLHCHTIGAQSSGLIIAHDARIVAIPVDATNNNLKTGKQS